MITLRPKHPLNLTRNEILIFDYLTCVKRASYEELNAVTHHGVCIEMGGKDKTASVRSAIYRINKKIRSVGVMESIIGYGYRLVLHS